MYTNWAMVTVHIAKLLWLSYIQGKCACQSLEQPYNVGRYQEH